MPRLPEDRSDSASSRRGGTIALSLRARLVLLVTLSVVPLLIFSLAIEYRNYREDSANAGQRTLDLARGMSLTVAQELRAEVAAIQTLALSAALEAGDIAAFRHRADGLVAHHFQGAAIVLLREDGQQVMNTALPVGAPLPRRPELDSVRQVFATGAPSISNLFQSTAVDRPVVAVDVPVTRADGSVVYVLSIISPLDTFAEVIRRQQIPEGWVASVFDRRGVNVARVPNADRFVGHEASPQLLPALLAEREGVINTTSLEGISLLTGFSHAEPYGWSVGIGVPWQELTAPALRTALLILGVGGALLVLTLAAALIVARQITGPMAALRRLAATVDGTGGGRFDATGLREVNEIAGALRMAAARRHAAEETRTRTEEDLRRLNETLEQRIAERVQQLQESERRFGLLVEAVTDYAIFMLDAGGNVVNWNAGAQRIKGYRAEEIIGHHFSQFYSEVDRQNRVPEKVIETASRIGRCETEGWRVRKDGSHFWGNVVIDAIRAPSGQLLGFAKITRDLTEKRSVEEQLRQAQKMEAIGQLTGGIAHDFNNLLTSVIFNIDFIRSAVPNDEAVRGFAESALRSAERGAKLVSQLLSFGRRQMLRPRPLMVDQVLADMRVLIDTAVGATIEVAVTAAPGCWPCNIDKTQLEAAVLNLTLNARDAMPGGGRLTFIAENISIAAADAVPLDLAAGDYLKLSVADTGTGMPPAHVQQAFDPYFTTKDVGKGSGLGLSQVYGFAKQSGGTATIHSVIGKATTVCLFLPRLVHDAAADRPAAAFKTPIKAAAGTTILIVEDEADVRDLLATSLGSFGYRAVVARDAAEAMAILASETPLGLLFSDIVLPGSINGVELARQARQLRQDLKVLLTSGHPREHHGGAAGFEFLAKPYTPRMLAGRIRELLDADPPTPNSRESPSGSGAGP